MLASVCRLQCSSFLRTSTRIPMVLDSDKKRQFSMGIPLARERYILGKTKGMSAIKLRGATIDESENEIVNVDALAMATDQEQSAVQEEEFIQFPDDETNDKLYNGVKYKDLPYVTVICAPNNTKFWGNDKNGNKLLYRSPTFFGFQNATKRTNIAAQITGVNVGQLLRNQSVTTIRVRISGFNNGRVAALKGLVQAGMDIVSVSDITPIDWHTTRRPKKRKRQN